MEPNKVPAAKEEKKPIYEEPIYSTWICPECGYKETLSSYMSVPAHRHGSYVPGLIYLRKGA